MKIAFVYDAVYPWVKGGGEKRIYEISKRLVKKGHEVHIFGIKWWNGSNIIENEGVILHGVCEKMELYVNGRRSISEAIIFSIKLLPHLYKESKERFDIIDISAFPYFSCFTAKLVCIIKGTPLIITWHEVWSDYWYEYIRWKGFFGKFIEDIVSKLANKSIATSKMTKNNLISLGIDSKNIYIIPNGVNLKEINEVEPNIDKCDIIFVGRLIKEKNVDILLKAVDYIREKLPDIKCHIIGNGPEKEKLIKYVIDRGITDNVKFLKFIEYDEVISRIKSSKILVLPSSREGFGIVIIEAFACGVPVIIVRSPLNAASELVKYDNDNNKRKRKRKRGLIVNLDIKELGDAIHMLITDNALRKNMSRSVINAVRKYDWDNIVNKLNIIYKD